MRGHREPDLHTRYPAQIHVLLDLQPCAPPSHGGKIGDHECGHAQVQTALGAILRDPKAKEMPCGVFGSFGWSGEAVDELEKRLKVQPLCQDIILMLAI